MATTCESSSSISSANNGNNADAASHRPANAHVKSQAAFADGMKAPGHKEPVYVVLRSTSLFLYENDLQRDCIGVSSLEDCLIELVPYGLKVDNYFKKENPIKIYNPKGTVFSRSSTCYLYASSAIDKEDWFLLMKGSIQKVKTSSQSNITCLHRQL